MSIVSRHFRLDVSGFQYWETDYFLGGGVYSTFNDGWNFAVNFVGVYDLLSNK